MRIVVGNSAAELTGVSREVARIVRHQVAYRQQVMPPIDAQKILKGYFKVRGRRGGRNDLVRLWADEEVRVRLDDLGVNEETLTRAQLETTLRSRGVWDGWVRLMGANGRFPAGLVSHVQRALRLRAGVGEAEVVDNRGPAPRGSPWIEPSAFDFQAEAVEAFLAATRGVVALPPRSGKTRIAQIILARLGLPALYIAPTVGIVRQTVARFKELWGDTVMAATGGVRTAKKGRQLSRAMIVVSTPKTAAKLHDLGGREVLIIDEFHHAAATTWQAVSDGAHNAYWRLGLTGTHFRADGRDMEMKGVLAEAVYSRSVTEMVKLGRVVPARIAMIRIAEPLVPDNVKGSDVYHAGITEHWVRNWWVAHAGKMLIEAGKRLLVLTKEVAHAERLAESIEGAVSVDGRDNDDVDRRLAQLAAGEIPAVVGTSVIGEGRDVPAADAMIYAAGGRSPVKVTQDYFRVLTASPGKEYGIVIDFADMHHPSLLEQATDRLCVYRSEPAFQSTVVSAGEGFERWMSDNCRS